MENLLNARSLRIFHQELTATKKALSIKQREVEGKSVAISRALSAAEARAEMEYQETLNKARGVKRAIEMANRGLE